LFHSLAFTSSTSNIASVFDIDMADDSIFGNIIFNDRDKKDKVRGCSSVSSTYSSRFLLVFSDKSTKEYLMSVVATTCWNSTCDMLTSEKLSVGYLVVGITRELDKKPSLHCSSIYINTMWSVLQQCVYLMSYYSSIMLLPQGHHAMSICPNIILF